MFAGRSSTLFGLNHARHSLGLEKRKSFEQLSIKSINDFFPCGELPGLSNIGDVIQEHEAGAKQSTYFVPRKKPRVSSRESSRNRTS